MPFTVDFPGKQKWWVHFPGNETLNFLWRFPVSIDRFLRCSHLLERHPWLPAKEAKSCLYDLNGLQLPSLPGIWKKHILLLEVLLSPLQNCWRVSWAQSRADSLPLKIFMLKKLGLLLVNSATSTNDILKGFFSWPFLLIVFFLHYQRYFLFPIISPEVSFSPGWNKQLCGASGGFTWSLLTCHVTKDLWMWHLKSWFSDGPGRAGLKDLKGLSQPKQFYDSKMMWDLW